MEKIFLDFYSQPSRFSFHHFTRGRHGIFGRIHRFVIPLLKAAVPVFIDTVSDYITKDISLTQAITDNVKPSINKLKRKLIENNHNGIDHRRKVRAVSV